MNTNIGLLGRKVGMTQFWDDNGKVVPCTIVEAGPCPVIQVKTADGADGYNAIQIGFYGQKKQRLSKAQQGHFERAGTEPTKVLREFRVKNSSDYSVGQTLTVDDVFKVGQKADVVGTSKGRGYAGVMKRHNFAGQRASHGVKKRRFAQGQGQEVLLDEWFVDRRGVADLGLHLLERDIVFAARQQQAPHEILELVHVVGPRVVT